MGMASAAAAAGGESWIVERAKEELQMLEAMHPNGFDYLKLELKSFIFEDANTYSYPSAAAAAAATQASSNNRHKREKCEEIHDEQTKHGDNNSPSSSEEKKKKKKKKDRVDMAIEKAEACLKRIQLAKQTFFQ